MVDFTRQREFKTREAVLPVDGSLPPGVHVFQLVVEDTSGNRSTAARVKIQIDLVRTSFIPNTPTTGRSRRPKKKTP